MPLIARSGTAVWTLSATMIALRSHRPLQVPVERKNWIQVNRMVAMALEYGGRHLASAQPPWS
jgi:hypothetical protein